MPSCSPEFTSGSIWGGAEAGVCPFSVLEKTGKCSKFNRGRLNIEGKMRGVEKGLVEMGFGGVVP